MLNGLRYLGQAAVFGLIALCLGYFADSPSVTLFPPERAQLLLSFSHGGQRVGECRKLTREEIAKMAANMRRAELCPRERHPISVELELSGEPLYRAEVPPTGLSGDGASQVYQRFTVAPGKHHLVARLRDGARTEGFDFESAADIELEPKQNYVVDFRAEHGGFIFGSGGSAAP